MFYHLALVAASCGLLIQDELLIKGFISLTVFFTPYFTELQITLAKACI